MKLSKEQYNELWTAYESALNVDIGASGRVGEHALLVQMLIEYGFNVGDVIEAYEVCSRIFGW